MCVAPLWTRTLSLGDTDRARRQEKAAGGSSGEVAEWETRAKAARREGRMQRL